MIYCPAPFGFGGKIGNDFGDHRVWWTQMETFFLYLQTIPQWNCLDENGLGAPNIGGRGMASLYPFRWWLYIPTFFGGEISYLCHHIQIFVHGLLAMSGLYLIMTRNLKVDRDIAILSSSLFLLNLRFNDFVRYPNGIEAIAWIPWMIFFVLKILDNKSFKSSIYGFSKREWKTIICLLLCTQLSWLAAYGQMTYIGLLVIGVILLTHLKQFKQIMIATFALIIGTTLAVGNLYPIFDTLQNYLAFADRSYEWANEHYIISYFEQVFNPFNVDIFRNTTPLPIFIIIFSMVLLISFFSNINILKNKFILGLIISFLLILDTTKGPAGFTSRILFEYLPFFDSFRNPVKNTFILVIPFSILMALSLNNLRMINISTTKISKFLLLANMIIISIHFYYQYNSKFVYQFSPISLGFINTPNSSILYIISTIISSIIIYKYWISEKLKSKAICMTLLTLCFIITSARFNTWTKDNTEKGIIAQNSIKEFFPNGILNNTLLPNGINLTENKSNQIEIQSILLNDFPQNRFIWSPTDKVSSLDFHMLSFSSSSLLIKPQSFSPGKLIFLQNYHPTWSSNFEILPFLYKGVTVMALDIDKNTPIKINFHDKGIKLGIIITLTSSLLLVTSLICYSNLHEFCKLLIISSAIILFGSFLLFSQNIVEIPNYFLFGEDSNNLFSCPPTQLLKL